MKFVVVLILFLQSFYGQAQQQFQLARPYIRYPTVFFDAELPVVLAFEQPGATIMYTTDQSTPHAKSKRYKKLIIIKQTTTIKARSFAKGFTPSGMEEVTFIKNGLRLTVDFPSPNEAYPGTGANTLTDNKGGITNHTANTWLGYHTDSVCMIINPEGQPELRELLFNVLQSQANWIFSPSKVSISKRNSATENWQPLQTITIPAGQNEEIACKTIRVPLENVKTGQLKLVLFNTILPTWHPGAGSNSWIFIDEIKVY